MHIHFRLDVFSKYLLSVIAQFSDIQIYLTCVSAMRKYTLIIEKQNQSDTFRNETHIFTRTTLA